MIQRPVRSVQLCLKASLVVTSATSGTAGASVSLLPSNPVGINLPHEHTTTWLYFANDGGRVANSLQIIDENITTSNIESD